MISVNSVVDYVNERFTRLGVNKRQEIARLIFEIAKRESCDFLDIIKDSLDAQARFIDFKRYLVGRRFPDLSRTQRNLNPCFPALDIHSQNRLRIEKNSIAPSNVFIEEAVANSDLVQRLKYKFPRACFETIPSYSAHFNTRQFSLEDYNDRCRNFYVIKEKFTSLKKCPCSPKSVGCGYAVVNLGVGCAFECAYCCLQDFAHPAGIFFPGNIEDFFDAFEQYPRKDIRIGSGEFTDSLVFDDITEFSPRIVEFFRKYPKILFEFKTKSNNIKLLTSIKPAENIVVGWSLNPQTIIDTTEFYTASFEERLQAAVDCSEAGYKIAFHFDPIIYYANWEKDYQDIVTQIFDRIPAGRIEWISLGTLRMKLSLKKVIENRFPENTILDGELIEGHDGKLRYAKSKRLAIYQKILTWIQKRTKSVKVYLCMEDKTVYQKCSFLDSGFMGF